MLSKFHFIIDALKIVRSKLDISCKFISKELGFAMQESMELLTHITNCNKNDELVLGSIGSKDHLDAHMLPDSLSPSLAPVSLSVYGSP